MSGETGTSSLDLDDATFSSSILRNLCDRSYDKRKIAAKEIETLVKSFLVSF